MESVLFYSITERTFNNYNRRKNERKQDDIDLCFKASTE